MTRFFTLLLLITLLCACVPATAPAATLTPTDVPATATPEPTSAPTVEPTKNPAQTAAELGLNQERTYVVRGDYLVDTYNQAPKAVRSEDGSWRALDYEDPGDAEVMYGHLVPKNQEYIDNQLLYTVEGNFVKTSQIYLGDSELESDMVRGQSVEVIYLMVGLRSGDGRLHVSRMGIDALGLKPDHWYILGCRTKDGGTAPIYPYLPVEEMMDQKLVPGDAIDFDLLPPSHTYPKIEFKVGPEKYPLANHTGDWAMLDLFNANKGKMMSEGEWNEVLERQRWPDHLVYLYASPLYIKEPDCR